MSQQKKAALKAGRQTTLVSAAVNSLLALVKTVFGTLSNSTALIADGIHSIADLITDFFAYIMLHIGHAEPDDTHPYGHGKFETIGALILGGMLAVTALWIGYDSLQKIFSPEIIEPIHSLALWAAAFSILANEGLFYYCKHMGEKVKSRIIIANAWHHRSDSLSSVAALIGIALSLYGVPMADAFAALAVTAFLLHAAYEIIREAFDELVDAGLNNEELAPIRKTVLGTPGVTGEHFLRARKVGGQTFVDVHIEVPSLISVSEGHAIAESVEQRLLNMEDIEDVVVHVDPAEADDTPLPTQFCREKFEPKIERILTEKFPEITLEETLFHMLQNKAILEVTLSCEKSVCPTKNAVISLKKELENTLKEFDGIGLKIKV